MPPARSSASKTTPTKEKGRRRSGRVSSDLCKVGDRPSVSGPRSVRQGRNFEASGVESHSRESGSASNASLYRDDASLRVVVCLYIGIYCVLQYCHMPILWHSIGY